MQIPAAMAAYKQWVLWIAVPSKTRPGKTDKFPIDPRTGRVAGHNDPAIRMTGPEAVAALSTVQVTGIGFVITPEDPFFCLDIDDAMTPTGWSPVAQQLVGWMDGCYVEVSHSGTGIHVIGTTLPFTCGEKNKLYKLDLYGYGKGHFIAMTGYHARGDAGRPVDLSPLIAWPGWSGSSTTDPAVPPAEWTTSPVPEWNGPTDDNDLITRILLSRPSAAAVLSGKATVQDLWSANPDPLSRSYPDNHGREFNHSDADMALCQHLAFWTGKDAARIDRLFRQSALYRDKWDRGDGYNQRTILKAIGQCRAVLGDRQTTVAITPQSSGTTDSATGEMTGVGVAYCTVSEQPDYFAGCCYIRDQHRILVPDGALLTPDRFRATYGGRLFMLDSQGSKTTKSAFECFTESQAIKFPKAHGVCFRPEQTPGAITMEEDRTVINMYKPIETRRIPGDPTPFTDLIRKMIPIDRDREILLTYMAALVQNPGVKFQWWPVLQGTEGNGKSAIIRCLAHAVGQRYTHIPNVDDMARNGAKFNSWVVGKLFIGIEEIYVNDRRDFLEAFKATVTNDRIQIEGKGQDQVMGDNRVNGVMCTNHKDGVPISTDQRRYSVLYTAQQCKEDKERDGMGGAYFPDLYDWFAGRGKYAQYGANYGYAIVNEYLRNYVLCEEFNPARNCQEAPRTSSTDEAITLSLGTVEQEIMEAIASGQPGFNGSWVSSLALDKLLEESRIGHRLPRAKRRELMRGLGYDWHPGLNNGRVFNSMQDACGKIGKPVLYCKRGHPLNALRGAGEIIKHYMDAQTGVNDNIAAVFRQEVR